MASVLLVQLSCHSVNTVPAQSGVDPTKNRPYIRLI